MKKVLFVILLLLSELALLAEGKSVFPTSDAIWNIQIDKKEYYYGLVGDSLINDTLYHKLYLLNDTIPSEAAINEYVGGFRVEKKQVWFRPFLSDNKYSKETKLYDFTKNAGDTIWHDIIPNKNIHYWTIGDSISASVITSIETNRQGIKIYNTEHYMVLNKEFFPIYRNDRWQEGIGSIEHGLFWFLANRTTAGLPKIHLLCFKQNNEIEYLDPNCTSCFPNVSSSISDNSKIPLELFYKSGNVCIRGELPDFPSDLKVYSLQGELVFEKDVLSSANIPLSLPAGIYIYKVLHGGCPVLSGKLMIKE